MKPGARRILEVLERTGAAPTADVDVVDRAHAAAGLCALPSTSEQRAFEEIEDLAVVPTRASVLIIGDDRMATARLARVLVATGLSVATAHCEAELESEPTDRAELVVLDYRRPLDRHSETEALLVSTPRLLVLAHDCNGGDVDELIAGRGDRLTTKLAESASTRDVISTLATLAATARA